MSLRGISQRNYMIFQKGLDVKKLEPVILKVLKAILKISIKKEF